MTGSFLCRGSGFRLTQGGEGNFSLVYGFLTTLGAEPGACEA